MKLRRLVFGGLAASAAALAVVPAAQAEIRSGTFPASGGRALSLTVTTDNRAGSLRLAVTFAPGITGAYQGFLANFGSCAGDGTIVNVGGSVQVVGSTSGAHFAINGVSTEMALESADGGATLIASVTAPALVGRSLACISGSFASADTNVPKVEIPVTVPDAPPAPVTPTPTPAPTPAPAPTPTPGPTVPVPTDWSSSASVTAFVRGYLAQKYGDDFATSPQTVVQCPKQELTPGRKAAFCLFAFRIVGSVWRQGSVTVTGGTAKAGRSSVDEHGMRGCHLRFTSYGYGSKQSFGRRVRTNESSCTWLTKARGWADVVDALAVRRYPGRYHAPRVVTSGKALRWFPDFGRYRCTTRISRNRRWLATDYAIACTNALGFGWTYAFSVGPTS